ncbi:UNVERIFIED_CONTAM: hypothetical protein Sangu_2475800 [Sesamum angustifolium]|uniref:Endonuclease/exonuclease/phosphatase domain-containing protein n=1 Tax=Sesamum angustifolium TaxID=2727405 RepID=A0AAW2IPM8_9LAMI
MGFCGFYGEPKISQRKKTWDLLTRLKAQSIRSWLCMGDFNEILDNSEKEGGNTRPPWQIRDFRTALETNRLYDIGFNGYSFTWSNKQEFPNTIRERLDRACADYNWLKLFPRAQISHSSSVYSYHSPIILQTDIEGEFQPRHTHRPFRFEAAWAGHDECDEIIKRNWRDGSRSTEEDHF